MKQTLDTNDYAIIATIIDTATQRGLFRAGDLETIGKLFAKVKSHLPQPEEKKDDVKK